MIASYLYLTFMCLAFQVTPELRQHVEAGLKAKTAGDLVTAAHEFELAAQLAPGLAAAQVNLGAVYLEKKDYAAAIPPLRKALELNPDLPGAHGMLGAALLAQGFADESISHLEKAQANDLLGVALLESGRVREAIDPLESALQKRPDDPDLLYYLSRAHEQLSKQLLNRLRDTGPESARKQQILGDVAAQAGNREAAERHFRAALELRPDLRGIHYAIGELYLASGDYEHAESEFRAEVQRSPGSAAAAYKLGLILLNRGQVRDAVVELTRANTLEPDMPETFLSLGKAMAATGDTAGAEKLLRRVLEHEQTSGLAETAHFQLAQIYRKLGRSSDADNEMKLFQKLRDERK